MLRLTLYRFVYRLRENGAADTLNGLRKPALTVYSVLVPTILPAIDVYAGDSLVMTMNLADLGGPVDFSDWTFSAQWRTSPTARDFVAATVDEANKETGTLVVSFPKGPSGTGKMGVDGVWDLQGVRTDGFTWTWIVQPTRGQWDVTRG